MPQNSVKCEQSVHASAQTYEHAAGLAAGFDKDAAAVKGLLGLGFGFVEVGKRVASRICTSLAQAADWLGSNNSCYLQLNKTSQHLASAV